MPVITERESSADDERDILHSVTRADSSYFPSFTEIVQRYRFFEDLEVARIRLIARQAPYVESRERPSAKLADMTTQVLDSQRPSGRFE
jgi:hypothetical protein